MIRETTNLYSIVGKEYADTYFNVFYSSALLYELKQNDQRIFLYSDVYLIPVTISRRAFFLYAHLFAEPVKIGEGNQTLRSFLNEVCDYLHNVKKIQWINQNNPASFFLDYPDGAKHIPFGSHVIDLNLDEETLWKNVHSKHRNVIKKAEKDGVIIECGRTLKLINDYHLIDVETWKRSHQNASSKVQLENRLKSLANNGIIYIAYKDGVPQSGAVYYYNEVMCYYMFGANRNNPHIGSGNLLQWRAILDMKVNGVQKFSFVGCRINEDEESKYHGIQRFKERFGGDLVQGYLFKMEFCPIMRYLFDFAVSLQNFRQNYRIVRYKDIIDQEIHKWPQK